MKNFSYIRPTTLDGALHELSSEEQRDVLAGGTTMVDLMKLGVVSPDRLVDLTGIKSLERYEIGTDLLRFGALARMAGDCRWRDYHYRYKGSRGGAWRNSCFYPPQHSELQDAKRFLPRWCWHCELLADDQLVDPIRRTTGRLHSR